MGYGEADALARKPCMKQSERRKPQESGAQGELVAGATGVHPEPYRTRQLSL